MYDDVLRTYLYKTKVTLQIARTRVDNLSQNINILLFYLVSLKHLVYTSNAHMHVIRGF